jgi:hypothetical protein
VHINTQPWPIVPWILFYYPFDIGADLRNSLYDAMKRIFRACAFNEASESDEFALKTSLYPIYTVFDINDADRFRNQADVNKILNSVHAKINKLAPHNNFRGMWLFSFFFFSLHHT